MVRYDLMKHDRLTTEANRNKLASNKNLLLWYETLYNYQFNDLEDIADMSVLEIGSGASPLKMFYQNVISSDILPLSYLDQVFDCHEIDHIETIKDESLNVITFTNVLHHLRDPVLFLRKAAVKLKPHGRIIMTEPFYSILSTLIYRCLHHEPSDFTIERPCLQNAEGPLTSANMALPYMIFFTDKGWEKPLRHLYDYSTKTVLYFSAISYMATGGISKKIPVPHFLYKGLLRLDLKLAAAFPRLFSAFFILTLTRK